MSLGQFLIHVWDLRQPTFLTSHTTLPPQAFCTGGDVRTAVTRSQAGEIEAVEGFFRIEYLLVFAIANLHITSVALIDGLVMGGGVGVSIYATFRVATER